MRDNSPPSLVLSITSNGEIRFISPYTSSKSASPRAANTRSKASVCSNPVMTANPFQEKKPPHSQPASSHPPLFLVQLALSQEGVGQIPPCTCGVCDSAVIALCDGAGLLEGGTDCGPCSPLLCGCCPVRTVSPAYWAWGKGL